MCKELEERKNTPNINLHFNSFCDNAINKNKENLMKIGYINLQYNYIKQNGFALPDDVANGIVKQFWQDYKEAGYIDFLNRLV